MTLTKLQTSENALHLLNDSTLYLIWELTIRSTEIFKNIFCYVTIFPPTEYSVSERSLSRKGRICKTIASHQQFLLTPKFKAICDRNKEKILSTPDKQSCNSFSETQVASSLVVHGSAFQKWFSIVNINIHRKKKDMSEHLPRKFHFV